MRCEAAVADQRTNDQGEPDRAGQQPVGHVRQALPHGQVLTIVDVEGGVPRRGWRPGRLGLSAAAAPVATQVSAAAMWTVSSRWKVVEPGGISP
jgi:hypothetical protein